MNAALECSHPPCRRRIYHPSGRCQDHRSSRAPRAAVSGGTPASLPVATFTPPVDAPEIPVTSPSTSDPDSHRTEIRYPNGKVEREEWRNARGELSRTDGPAVTTYNSYGFRESEEWKVDGVAHRTDGPALVVFDSNDQPATGFFRENGKSREGLDGHSLVYYDSGGVAYEEHWYLGVDPVGEERRSSRREVAADLLEYSDVEVERMVASSRYAPLLAEGNDARRITEVLAEGVNTVEGVREAIGGAPIEWVRSWETSS